MATPLTQISRPEAQRMDLVGTPAAVDGLSVREFGTGAVRQTEFTFVNVQATLVDNGTTGAGSLLLATLPLGLNAFLGAAGRLNLGYSAATQAGLVAAVGTVAAAADGTLSGTEANIVPSTACAIASSVGVFFARSTAALFAAGVIDGTSTANQIRLNFGASAEDPGANRTITINGRLTVTWMSFGDGTGA